MNTVIDAAIMFIPYIAFHYIYSIPIIASMTRNKCCLYGLSAFGWRLFT